MQARPPPSSYKPTGSKAGNNVTTAGRPISNRGMNYMSNDLAKKANELNTTKYKAELEKKTSNP